MYSEEIITFGENSLNVGVFTSPSKNRFENSPCLVFINAGIIHKIGPNRIYVKIARSLSESGFSSFRFDINNIPGGSVDGTTLNENSKKNQEIKTALDALESCTGCNEFVLIGICSGAEEIFNYDIEDYRVKGLSLIDGTYQKYETAQELFRKAVESSKARYYKKHAFSITRWKKLLTGKSNFLNKKKIMSLITEMAPIKKEERRTTSSNNINKKLLRLDIWNGLFKKKKHVLLVFCEGGIAFDLYNMTLRQHLKSEYLKIEYIKNVDHTFTPQWSQKYLIDITINWINTLEFK